MRRLAVAGACLALAVLAGCGGDDHSGPQKLDLKIGNLLPMTGTLDPFGRPSQRAAEVAAEEIRKAAAKAGARHTVTLKSLDYKSEPATAVRFAEALAKDGFTCLTGPFGSGHAGRVGAQVSTPKRVLQITPSASAGQITDIKDRGYLNRVVPPDTLQVAGADRAHVARAARRQGQEGQHRRDRLHLRQGPDEGVREGMARQGRHGGAEGHLPAPTRRPSPRRPTSSARASPTRGCSSTSPTPTCASPRSWSRTRSRAGSRARRSPPTRSRTRGCPSLGPTGHRRPQRRRDLGSARRARPRRLSTPRSSGWAE